METKTIVSFDSPLGGAVSILKQTFAAKGSRRPVKRVSFMAGLHGDELEGIYICCLLVKFLRELEESQPNALRGEVNIYPAVNPSAINSATRLWPFFSSDMNRTLGQKDGMTLPELASKAFMEDLVSSADLAVDFHASNLQLKELPQIRIIEKFADKLTPLAEHCGMDLIWIHPTAGIFESTLGYNLNKQKIPALVVETGTCLRINQKNCEQIFAGMINLLEQTGTLVLNQKTKARIKSSRIVHPAQVTQINSRASGLFICNAHLGSIVGEGEALGQIVNPVHGEVLEEVVSSGAGLLFTLREQPLVYEGALLARVALDADPET